MENESTTPKIPEEQVVPSRFVIIGVIILLAVSMLSIVLVLWLAISYPQQIEALRDVFIIALALESCIFGIVLILQKNTMYISHFSAQSQTCTQLLRRP